MLTLSVNYVFRTEKLTVKIGRHKRWSDNPECVVPLLVGHHEEQVRLGAVVRSHGCSHQVRHGSHHPHPQSTHGVLGAGRKEPKLNT